jgi:hypothetical protein
VPNKYTLVFVWIVFGLSSIVTVISAARLPADGACWTVGCMSVMLPALALMFVSVRYLNHLSGNTLMYSASKCAQTSTTTEASIITYISDLRDALNTFQPNLENRQASLDKLQEIQYRYCYSLSQPALRAQLFVLFDIAQAKHMIDTISRAERLLNRAWSALSDNCEAEAQTAYAQAQAICADIYAQLPKQ